MDPEVPTNFNDTSVLIEYGKDLGITVGIGFLVPAIVFSFVLIVVFVKFCGAGKGEKTDVFSSSSRAALVISAAVIVTVAGATCAVGWIYNQHADQGIQNGSDTLQWVIFSSASIMLSVNESVFDFKIQLIDEVNKTLDIAQNISTLLIPVNGVLNIVDDADNTLHNFTLLTVAIANNITAVKKDLDNLDAAEQDGVIDGVPSADEVPDINEQYVSALNQSTANLNYITSIANNFSSDVNTTLNEVTDTIENELIAQTSNYNTQVNVVLSYFSEFYHQVQETNDTYNKYSHDVIHYSSIRTSVVAAVLVLPIVLAGLALLGVFFRIKLMLKLSAGLCFLFMFWYFLIAGINFAAYYTLNGVCDNQVVIVGNAISITKSAITVPGTNRTVLVSEAVKLLLKCSGNTTIIEIFEFNFLIDDLTGNIATELNSAYNESQLLNQTTQYETALEQLKKLENNSVNLDFILGTNLTQVHTELNDISKQLAFVINNPAYNQSLQAVNNITNNLLLTNGTTIHMYYTAANITTLNCQADPYNKLNQTTQQDLCAKSATAISMTNIRNRAISEAPAINGNISDINQRLYGFQDSLSTISRYQNETNMWASQIQGYLTQAYDNALELLLDFQSILTSVSNLITAEVEAIEEQTQCAYVGDAYVALSNNVCTQIRPALEILTAMMILGAFVFFSSAIVSTVTLYKIDKDYYSES